MEDTESILAKAIRDGGIEASIDHDNGWMTCKDRVDVYATNEPQSAFHARVAFCLDIHNEVGCSFARTSSLELDSYDESINDGRVHLSLACHERQAFLRGEDSGFSPTNLCRK